MRLSEAIRLGSLAIQNPQACDTRYCAIGMGLEAIGRRNMECEENNFRRLWEIWPWTQLKFPSGESFLHALYIRFDSRVMFGTMTIEQLCDQVGVWEDDLAAKGINVEQVTMIATPEATHEPAAEKSEMVGVTEARDHE